MGEPASVRHLYRRGSAKGEDKCPSELLRRGHRWPSLWNNSLNGLKAGMGRGARAPPIVWERGGGQVSRQISLNLKHASEDRRKEGTRAPNNFWEGGGTDGPACVRHLWMDSNRGPRKEGSHAPSNFNKGHRSVCIPDLREFKLNNIIHWHFIEV